MLHDFSRDGCLKFLCSEEAKSLWASQNVDKLEKYGTHLIEEVLPKKDKIVFQKIIGLGGEAVCILCYGEICKRFLVFKIAFPDANAKGIRTVYRESASKSTVEHFNIIRERFIRGGAQIQSALALEISRVFGYIPVVYYASEFPVYISMEFLEGSEPVSFFKDSDFRVKFEFFYRLLALCSFCHSYQIIHRDLKPSNVMVIEEEGIYKPSIIDWTFSKQYKGEEESISTMDLTAQSNYNLQINSRCFSSPKLVEGGAERANYSDDVFSLGRIMYCIILGYVPPSPQDFNDLKEPLQLTNGSVLEQSKLPVDLIDIYSKATNSDERQRYSTVSEFLVDLEKYAYSINLEVPELKISVPEQPSVKNKKFDASATTDSNLRRKIEKEVLSVDLSNFSGKTQSLVYNLCNIVNESENYIFQVIRRNKDEN